MNFVREVLFHFHSGSRAARTRNDFFLIRLWILIRHKVLDPRNTVKMYLNIIEYTPNLTMKFNYIDPIITLILVPYRYNRVGIGFVCFES